MAEQVAERDSTLESLHVQVDRLGGQVRLVIRNQQLVMPRGLARELVRGLQAACGEEVPEREVTVVLREMQCRVPESILRQWLSQERSTVQALKALEAVDEAISGRKVLEHDEN